MKELNFDGSEIECSCLNNWLLDYNYVSGYNCQKEEENNCAPVVIKDNYNFAFALETSQKAYVSKTSTLPISLIMCSVFHCRR